MNAAYIGTQANENVQDGQKDDQNGGDEENRTPDPLLARQVLSQLSYTPIYYGVSFADAAVP